MGIWAYLKSVFPGGQKRQYVSWMRNSTPIFSSFGQDIYMSDFVNNAIDRVASEVSKIGIKSIVEKGDYILPQNDEISRLFRFKPNPLQTTSDFLSNVEWLRRKNMNAFIYPKYEVVQLAGGTFRRYVGFYPLNPLSVRIGVNEAGDAWEIEFSFADGSTWPLPYEDLIHLRWRRGKNTVVGGGDDDGMPMIRDALRTVKALDKTIQGLPKSIEASLQIKGVYHAKTLAEAERLKAIRDDFEAHISTSASGMIATDLAGDFTPININPADISESALKFLKAVLRERYGVSEAIISGDYNGEQHSAFYQTAIEDFIVQLEQAFSACLFTPRQQDVGHRIKAYYNLVNYMSNDDKLKMAELAKETGNMTLNQVNAMLGMEPFEGGNRRLQSLNFASTEVVDKYQLAKYKEGMQNDEPT